jgi:hypothetical protein
MKSTEIYLVLEHLENVRSEIFQKYHDIISDYVSGKPGVYALYSNGALYYVGLASDMRNRLKTHLKDIHKSRWDTFSAYLTDGGKHLKELEALLIGIAKPKGNSVHGHFPRSENILPRLKKAIARHDKEKMNELLGISSHHSRSATRADKSLPIIAFYKGKTYKARVYPGGRVRFKGKRYESIHQAGLAITSKTAINGWRFWRVPNDNGGWVFVDVLRKRDEWPFLNAKKEKPAKPAKAQRPSKKSNQSAGMAQKLVRSLPLIAYYKGATYTARAFPDGSVRIGDKEYGSLSMAGMSITQQTACSGWLFWKARSSDGEWLQIDELRKRGEWPYLKTKQEKPTKTAKAEGPAKKPTKFAGNAVKLVAKYKGKIYHATLRRDGKVRMSGTLYGSLSGAAEAITGHPTSGPAFWKV